MKPVSPQVRSAIRQWLVGKNDLAGRKAIRRHLDKGASVHDTIVAVLRVTNWKQAMAKRKEARVVAKGETKKVQVKTVKRPVAKEGRLAKAA